MKLITIFLSFILCLFFLSGKEVEPTFKTYYQKGFDAIQKSNYPAAIYYLDSAIILKPQADSTYALLAFPYYSLGKYEKAIEYCNKALDIREANSFAWYVKGLASAMINVYSDSLFNIVKKHKKDSTWLAENIFNRYYISKQGIGIFDNGKAIEYLSRSIALDSSYVWAYSSRAHFYYRLNQYPPAEKDYTKCIELEPENAWHYLNRGIFYESFGPPGNARDDYSKGISLDPDIAELYERRGRLYREVWYDKEYACEDFRKATLLGRYIEDMNEYCKPTFMDNLYPTRYYHAPWRHNSKLCVCPDFSDMFNPETDTIKEIEIMPGVEQKMLDIKDDQKTTWEFEDGRVIEISKKTKERWLKEEEEKKIKIPLP